MQQTLFPDAFSSYCNEDSSQLFDEWHYSMKPVIAVRFLRQKEALYLYFLKDFSS